MTPTSARRSFEGGQARLARRADTYKKAVLAAAAWTGAPLPPEILAIPDYRAWPKRKLQQHIDDLESDLRELVAWILAEPRHKDLDRFADWLRGIFETSTRGEKPLSAYRAFDFEREWGLLRARERMEIPPYAELYLQWPYPLAIRHPEYMLARDLEFLLANFRESGRLCDNNQRQQERSRRPGAEWVVWCGENHQALGRAAILACFNLLESFACGLARAHVMTHDIDDGTEKKLLNNQGSLKQRLLTISKIVGGAEPPMGTDELLGILFDDIKKRRDSFVHCEPGPQASTKAGYIKDSLFHDVRPEVVETAVASTSKLIRTLWCWVHKAAEGPRWLPDLGNDQKDLRALKIAPPPSLP